MMPSSPVYQLVMLLIVRAPYWAAILFGAFLCYRNAGRKTREVWLASIALVLIVLGSVSPYLAAPVLQQMGLGWVVSPWGLGSIVSMLFALPEAIGLGLLLWAIFGDRKRDPQEERQTAKPVYRYED